MTYIPRPPENQPIVKGNNRYGAKGTIRCLACQRRKGKVSIILIYWLVLIVYVSVSFLLINLISRVNTAKEEAFDVVRNYPQSGKGS